MPAKRKYSLSAWPAHDRAAWEAETSAERSYYDRGPCAAWSPETKRQAFYAYSRWLAFLAKRRPETLRDAPTDRLTPALLEGFVNTLAKRRVSPQTMTSTINHFVNALRAVVPAYKPEWLRRERQRFSRRITPRNKRPDMEQAAAVSLLGFELMDRAVNMIDQRAAALTYRDGLLIAILMASALRRKNLTALKIGTHLRRTGQHYRLVIDASEMKSRRRFDRAVPEELSPYIERYLMHFRPCFASANECDELWLSTRGGALSKEGVWDAFRERTRAKFGHPINLHLARDMAATAAPRLGRTVLDHGKATLTDEHYRRSDSIAASRKLAAIIAALRAKVANHELAVTTYASKPRSSLAVADPSTQEEPIA